MNLNAAREGCFAVKDGVIVPSATVTIGTPPNCVEHKLTSFGISWRRSKAWWEWHGNHARPPVSN